MKIEQIINSVPTFKKLIQVSFPNPKTSLAIYKLTKQLNEYIDYYSSEYNKYFNQYQENGIIKPECTADFNAAIIELLNLEVSVDKISDLDFNLLDLEQCNFPDNNCWLSSADIEIINKFIKSKEG